MKKRISGWIFGMGLGVGLALSGCAGAPGTEKTPAVETAAAQESSVVQNGGAAQSGSVPPESSTEKETEYPYDVKDPSFFLHEGSIAHAPKAEVSGVTAEGKQFVLNNIDKFGVFQGSCTDGTWVYAVLENQKVPTEKSGVFKSKGIICKIDPKTWEVTAQSEELPLDHGNDITYNGRTGLLMVVNCYDNPYTITRVDPDTLTVVDTITIEHKIYGLAYHEEKDMYVAGIRETYDFVFMDAEFNTIKLVTGVDTGFIKQNIDCDDDYIYFVQYEQNSIICYNWDGEYAGAYYVKGCYAEAESMFHIGNQFYLGYNTGGGKGGLIYALAFDKAALK